MKTSRPKQLKIFHTRLNVAVTSNNVLPMKLIMYKLVLEDRNGNMLKKKNKKNPTTVSVQTDPCFVIKNWSSRWHLVDITNKNQKLGDDTPTKKRSCFLNFKNILYHPKL